MAGPDPNDPFAPRPSWQPDLGGQDDDEFMSFLAGLKRQKDTRDEAARNAAALESGDLGKPKENGFGGLRRAEAKMAADAETKTQFETFDEAQSYLDDYDQQLRDAEAQYEKARKQTLADYKAGRIDAQTLNQRMDSVFKPQFTALSGGKDSLRKAREELDKAAAEQKAGQEVDKGVLGNIAEWAPVKWTLDKLSMGQEIVAGWLSLSLDKSSPYSFFSPAAQLVGDEYTRSNIKVMPEDFIASPLGLSEDNPIRQRGREFNEKVGRGMTVAESYVNPYGSAVGEVVVGPEWATDAMAAIAPVGGDTLKEMTAKARQLGGGGATDDMINQLAFEASTDPLNFMEFAGASKGLSKANEAFKASEFGQRMIAKHPKLMLAPEKAWLTLNNKFREAFALSPDPRRAEFVAMEQTFNSQAGYEYGKLRNEILAGEARAFAPLNSAQKKQALELLPAVVEDTGAEERALMRQLHRNDPVMGAVYDAADLYDDAAAKKLALDQRFGLGTKPLDAPFNYFKRSYSDDFQAWLTANPTAQKVIQGAEAEVSRKAFNQGWQDFERARKFRDIDFNEAERIMRERLSDQAGLPENIWSRNAFADLAGDVDKAADAAKFRNVHMAFVDAFGEAQPVLPELQKLVNDGLDALPESADWTPKAKAAWIEAQVGDKVRPLDPKSVSALQIMRDAKVKLPENAEDLTRLATTFISPEDAKTFTKFLNNFYWQHATRSGLGKWYDAVKAVYQRATLGRLSSLSKDLIGTSSQGFIAGNWNELEAARVALGGDPVTWARGPAGYQIGDDVVRLQAEGVLHTTKGEALQTGFKGKLGQRIEKRGVLGSIIPGKAGEKVAKVTDAMLDARVWWEQVNRLATYRKAIKNGASHAEAVEDVYRYWGKFDEMSALDRKLFNRIFFFHSWMRASVPITLRALLDHPVRSRWLLTAMAGNISDDKNYPEWLRRMGGYALGLDQSGNASVVSTGNSSYFSPTFSFLQSDMTDALRQGKPAEAGSLALRDVMRASPPFVQAAGELAQQRDYFANRDWYDENGVQQTRAPIGFYWFTGDEPTAVQKVLNLTPVTDKDGHLKYVTMDPYWSWLFGATPGAEPLMQDMASFVDPRMEDNPYRVDIGDKGVGFSLKKGFARQIGLPTYSVPLQDQQARDIRKLQDAIRDDLKTLAGGALYRSESGYITPSQRTERGRAMAYDMEKWTQEGKNQGLSGVDLKNYIEQRMIRHYQNEWRIMEMNRRLQALRDMQEGKNPYGISRRDLGLRKFDAETDRYAKQGEREQRRKLSGMGLR